MNRWVLVCVAIVAVFAAVSLVNGHAGSAAIFGGVIIVALAGAHWAPRYRRSRAVESSLVLYATLFNAALVMATILLIVAALESGERERGGYIGLAILSGVAALALAPLTLALWKRLRGRSKAGRSDVGDATRP